jgi:hypothetical protein
MPLFILIMTISALIIAMPSQVHAASETVCVGYARHAVKEATDAQKLGCGFTGPRWSTDYGGHYNWCIGAQGQSVSQEAVSRGGPLMDCSACRGYADEAVNAARQNIAQGCGYNGPRWISNAQAHFGWCMQFGSGPATREASARRADLQNCRREFPKVTIPPPKATSCPNNMFLGPDGTCYPMLR